MTKLTVPALLVCFLASELISRSAARPLPPASSSLSDRSESSCFWSSSASTATESGSVFPERCEEAWTESVEISNEARSPCTEEDVQNAGSVDHGERPCDRRLEGVGTVFAMFDYEGPGETNPNPKPP